MKKLDLHGKRHDEETDRMVENFVLLNEPPTSIITGLSDRMKRIVINVCERHDVEYMVNPWNPGEIKIISW